MKKTVLSMIMATVVMAVSFAQDKRYGIERAILKKNTVMNMAGMQQTISSVQYIDDYGRKESTETFMSMQGQTFTVFTLMKDGYIYNANMVAKQGTKINMAIMNDYKTVNYLNITDELRQKYKIVDKGNEQVLGKACKGYELTITVQGQSVNVTVWVWQGLALKSSMNVAGNTINEEVTEIQEGAAISKEKFELPEGVTFNEMTPQL
jgi:hypothetical protein